MNRVFCTVSMLTTPLETLQALLALVMAPRISLHPAGQGRTHLDRHTTYAGTLSLLCVDLGSVGCSRGVLTVAENPPGGRPSVPEV